MTNLLISLALTTSINWYGIYLQGTKIGFANQIIEEKEDFIKISELSVMKLSMMGAERSIKSFAVYDLDKEYKIKAYSFEFKTEQQRIISKGEVKDGKLLITISTTEWQREKTIDAEEGIYPSSAIPMIMADVGKGTKKFNVFYPEFYDMKETTSQVMDRQGDSIKIKTTIPGATVISWIDKHGNVLRREEPGNILIVREPEKKALEVEEVIPEVVMFYVVPTKVRIKNPREVRYLTAILNNKLIKTERQKMKADTLEIRALGPISSKSSINGYLDDTPMIQCKDERIDMLADSIVSGVSNTWEKVKKITDWVADRIEDVPFAFMPSALDVLKTRQGDCNEHAVLFTALSRAVGIPAQVVVGLVYMDGGFVYHAWSKVYVGRWVEVDPTFPQYIADATHIALAEGELKDWTRMMDLLGKLKIEIIDYN